VRKCLHIMFSSQGVSEELLKKFMKKNAEKLLIEGLAQFMHDDKRIKIIACGDKEKVDLFLDILYKGAPKVSLDDIEVEPFVRDKDYRGVFRIIE
jgi:acylphosphatase